MILGIVNYFMIGNLWDEDGRDEELGARFESVLRILNIHDGAATDQHLAVVLFAEVGNAVCAAVHVRAFCRASEDMAIREKEDRK